MNYTDKYSYAPSTEQISRLVDSLAANLASLSNEDVFKKCFSLMDLTTLRNEDTEASVAEFTGKLNRFAAEYPAYPHPASICVYPNLAETVRKNLKVEGVHVTAVSGCFPTSQSFVEVKAKECEMAVLAGADEIDIVLALNAFLAGDRQKAFDEICAMRAAIDAAGEKAGRKIVLKVILETGLLQSLENIAEASFLAMEAGADFIKTSTGKVAVNATPAAACVMCECIRKYYEATGRKVGFKPAGGISSASDALCYYYIVSTILGQEWLNASYFRFGVSRLANQLVAAVEGRTVAVF